MKKILIVLAMVAASAFMAQPAIAADDVPPTQDTGQAATDPPVVPPVVVPPVVPPVVVPPVVPPVVVPPAPPAPPVTNPGGADPGTADPGGADPGGADPGGADPGTADPGGADPLAADPGAPTAKSFHTPEICPVITGLTNSDCDPTCEPTATYTKGKYCHPPCDEARSNFKSNDDCNPQCDDKWSPSAKFKSNDDCNPRCDDKWSPGAKFKSNDDCNPRCDDKWSPGAKFKSNDDCHPRCDDKWTTSKSRNGHCEPKCHDNKRGKDYSHSDNKGDRANFYNNDKKGHSKHRSHCPRPPKCERSDSKRDHKSWDEHSDDKPFVKNMKHEFSGNDWSNSRKHNSWDKKHKDHKDHCSTPKKSSDPSDPASSTSGVLPDTGGAPLWVLLMGGLMSAAGVTVLVRRSPVVGSSDSAGGGR
jgi:hypothetical protein